MIKFPKGKIEERRKRDDPLYNRITETITFYHRKEKFIMSKFTDRYNHVSPFTFEGNPEAPFRKLEELFEEDTEVIYPVRALYVNTKSKFGDAPVAVSDEIKINLPSHMLRSVNEIMEDEEAVFLINHGKIGITPYKYEKDGKTYYGAKWVDIDDPFEPKEETKPKGKGKKKENTEQA